MDKLTSFDAAVSVQMILQLDADLSVGRLLTEEWMFQQLICFGSLCIVFD